MKKNDFLFPTCVALTLLFSGCYVAPKPAGLPKLLPLTLTLTQEGAPLAGASVSLFADDGVSAWTVGGTTDAAGKVSPKTHGKYPGLPEGQYKVCVRKIEADVTSIPAKSSGLAKSGNSRSQDPPEYDLIDIPLHSPATTPLTLNVSRQEKNVTLDVGKPVRKRIATE